MIVKGNIKIVYPETEYAAEAANVNMPELPAFAARRIAEAFAKKLENYRIPAEVKKKTNIHSLLEISEKWLIVCCTPEAKNDDRIAEEINEFVNEDLREHIIPVLISGSPEESFPYALLHIRKADGTETDVEPLAANLTAPDIKKSLRKLNVEALRIFAPMLGVSFDELNRRDLRRKKRILNIIGAAVIAVAAGFLIYSMDKVKTISGQNKQINELYSEKKQAEIEMENQMNEAVYQNQLLLSRKAMEALDEYDVQLALEYCLDGFDMDNPEDAAAELKAAIHDALEIACASGYVPITSEKEYNRQNNINQLLKYDLRYSNGGYQKKYTDELPEEIRKTIEEINGISLSGKTLTADYALKAYSEKFGYAIYDVSYRDTDLTWNFYCEKIHFKDHPEDDYYLKDKDGEYLSISQILAWEDGTFTGDVQGNSVGYVKIDAFTGEWLELPDYYNSIYYTDDREYIIGIKGKNTFKVYNPETGEMLYSVTRPWVNGNSHKTFSLDDGSNYILFYDDKVHVYDISNRTESDFETDDAYISNAQISNEGLLMIAGDDKGIIYDIKSEEAEAEIPNTGKNGGSMSFYGKNGKYNLVYGAECIDSGNIIFEYHEDSIPVPETLEEKIKLAEQLIVQRNNEEQEGN